LATIVHLWSSNIVETNTPFIWILSQSKMAEKDVDINMEEDVELDDAEDETPAPNVKGRGKKTDDSGRKVKGRGFGQDAQMDIEERYSGKGKEWEILDSEGKAGPLKSVEGWILFVSGVHEEASEDDILDKFSEYGEVKNWQLPLDRRTGFVKGYALIEYASKDEAANAIKGLEGTTFMDSQIHVGWGFTAAGSAAKSKQRSGGRGPKRYSRN